MWQQGTSWAGLHRLNSASSPIMLSGCYRGLVGRQAFGIWHLPTQPLVSEGCMIRLWEQMQSTADCMIGTTAEIERTQDNERFHYAGVFAHL